MKNIESIRLAIQEAAKTRQKMAAFHSQVLLHAESLEYSDAVEFCRNVAVTPAYESEFKKMLSAARMLSELGYSIQKI
jgi:hypothetical protein